MKLHYVAIAAAFCLLGGSLSVQASQMPSRETVRKLALTYNNTCALINNGYVLNAFRNIKSFCPVKQAILSTTLGCILRRSFCPEAVIASAYPAAIAGLCAYADRFATAKLDRAAPQLILRGTAGLCTLGLPWVSPNRLARLVAISATISTAAACAFYAIKNTVEEYGWRKRSPRTTREAVQDTTQRGVFLLDAIADNNEPDICWAIENGCVLDGTYSSGYASRLMINSNVTVTDHLTIFFGENASFGWSQETCRAREQFFGYILSTRFAPLAYAAALGNIEMISLLLEKGANPHYQNDKGRTALHEAAYFNQPKAIQSLLQAGANPELIDTKGHTALTLAASQQHREVVTTLLLCGAAVPTDEQLAQSNLSEQACALIKKHAYLAGNRAHLIEQQCMKQHPDLSHDVAALARSFETATTPASAQPLPTDNVNTIGSLVSDALSFVF